MLVFVFFTCFFLFIARHRFIDGDEGFYLMASRLVLEPKTLYLDFLYTQAPLLLTIILGLLIYDMSAVKQRNVSPAWPP
jgi:hypothetical protein